ncbi:putative peroxisomal membrane protein pex16 [Papiliotrema laurentii]|uniref:Peroxisomal membrane protein PEX16 n=1 Tax=Papiliotrema laurentii TaxID=5418 RepID=A0AAD9L8B0_PAPLA|nr:putative peroxisomal membrane protein pex16 [Papiliotrema laurentii]
MDPSSTLSYPSSLIMQSTGLVEAYEELLVSNLGAVRSIESGLRNVSWLLPGRFQDAELASEGLYALLNAVSGYHDSLLSKHLDPALTLPPHPFDARPPTTTPLDPSEPSVSKTAPVLPPPSDHARYTKYWTTRSGVYRKASRLLVTIGYIELLVEMVARKRLGDRRRWNYVLGLEVVKTLLRLIILGVTGRPVLHPPTPQREYDLLSIPSAVLKTAKKAVIPTGPKASEEEEQPITALPSHGAVTPTLPPYAPLRSHLFPLTNALPEEHLAHPISLLPTLTPGQYVSEIIESSVTLLHVVLLLRSAKRRNTSYGRFSLPTLSSPTLPYLLPLLLCLWSRRLRRTHSKSILLAEHHANLDRRLAARAFLTGPMWVGWTRPKVMNVVRILGKVPIVNFASEFIEGYIPLVDEYFYYSS